MERQTIPAVKRRRDCQRRADIVRGIVRGEERAIGKKDERREERRDREHPREDGRVREAKVEEPLPFLSFKATSCVNPSLTCDMRRGPRLRKRKTQTKTKQNRMSDSIPRTHSLNRDLPSHLLARTPLGQVPDGRLVAARRHDHMGARRAVGRGQAAACGQLMDGPAGRMSPQARKYLRGRRISSVYSAVKSVGGVRPGGADGPAMTTRGRESGAQKLTPADQ